MKNTWVRNEFIYTVFSPWHSVVSWRLDCIIFIVVFWWPTTFRTDFKIEIDCVENSFWINIDFDFVLFWWVIFDHLVATWIVTNDLDWCRTKLILKLKTSKPNSDSPYLNTVWDRFIIWEDTVQIFIAKALTILKCIFNQASIINHWELTFCARVIKRVVDPFFFFPNLSTHQHFDSPRN